MVTWDFPDGPAAKTVLPMQKIQIWSLVGELDPTSSSHAATKDLHVATKTLYSQINKQK